MQTQNPQTIFHLSGNERFKFWNTFLGLYQTPNLDLISDEKKKKSFWKDINNNNNEFFKKKNLLTYINVSMDNSLNESEENSQSCPAKDLVFVTDVVERPK